MLLSICSEADAFVAASLSQFSLTARLAFLVVGPMVDLKLFAMQAGTFGRGFALRFAPATFAVAVLVSVLRRGGAAVNRQAQAVVLFLIGGAVLQAGFTDLYLRYVKAGLRPFLIAAGVVLIVAAVATRLVRAARPRRTRERPEPSTGPSTHDGHGHAHREPRVAWLLVLPVLALMLVAPPALGSYSASRTGTALQTSRRASPTLPAGDPLRLSVVDYAGRAVYDQGRSLDDRRIKVTGFVALDGDGAPYLARMILNCCAADAQPVKVGLTGETPARPAARHLARGHRHLHRKRTKDPVNDGVIPVHQRHQPLPVKAPAGPVRRGRRLSAASPAPPRARGATGDGGALVPP